MTCCKLSDWPEHSGQPETSRVFRCPAHWVMRIKGSKAKGTHSILRLYSQLKPDHHSLLCTWLAAREEPQTGVVDNRRTPKETTNKRIHIVINSCLGTGNPKVAYVVEQITRRAASRLQRVGRPAVPGMRSSYHS